jgi:hypothetical protein
MPYIYDIIDGVFNPRDLSFCKTFITTLFIRGLPVPIGGKLKVLGQLK